MAYTRDRMADLGKMAPDFEMIDMSESTFFEDFLVQISEIKNHILNLEKKVILIEQLQSKLLSSVRDNLREQKNLDNMTNSFVIEIKKHNDKLQELYKLVRQDKTEKRQVMDNHISITSANLKKVLHQYQEIRDNYSKQQKQAFSRQCQLIDPTVNQDQIDNILSTGISAGELFQMKKLKLSEQDLADIKERHNSIFALEKDMTELHEVFVQLAILVEQQDEKIDNIDTSIDIGANQVVQATRYLGDARRIQSSVQKKKLMIGCCLIVMLAIIALVLLSVIGHFF